MEQSLRNWGWL